MKSYSEVMGSFDPRKKSGNFFELHKPITVWVTNETKAAYDNIQAESGSAFSKTLRDVVSLAISDASQKAS